MPKYLLKKFDKVRQLKGYGEFEGRGDDEVIAWAFKLPPSYSYELWCEDRIIYRSDEDRPESAG